MFKQIGSAFAPVAIFAGFRSAVRQGCILSLAATLTFNTAIPAHAIDPVTGAVAIGGILSMFNRQNDINGARIEAILEMLSALGKNMDSVQGSLATVLERTENLGKTSYDATVKAVEWDRLNTVVAQVKTIRGLIEQAKANGNGQFKDGRLKGLAYQADIRRSALDLRLKREEISTMSVANVPGLVAAVYAEMFANQQSEYPEENAMVRRSAIAQLQKTLDDGTAGGFLEIETELHSDIIQKKDAIAKELGLPDGLVKNGTFPWFSHTLLRKEYTKRWQRFRNHMCFRNMDIPCDEDIEIDVPADVPVHTRTWQRQVRLVPVAGGSPDLVTIEVSPVPPAQELPGAVPGSTSHFNADADFEKADPRFNDVVLANNIALHNAMVVALSEYQRLEGLTRRTIAALSIEDSVIPDSAIEEAIALIGHSTSASDAIVAESSRQDTTARVEDMAAASANLHEVERGHQERIAKLIAENRKTAWIGDLQMGLTLYSSVAPLVDEMQLSTSHSSDSENASPISLPELGSEYRPKEHAYTLLAEENPDTNTASRANGAPSSSASEEGVTSPSSALAQVSAAWQDALDPATPRLPATGNSQFEQNLSTVTSRLTGAELLRSGIPFVVDEAQLTRFLMGNEGVEEFIRTKIQPYRDKIEDAITDYQARSIAGTLNAGDRKQATERIADLLDRLTFREQMIGLQPPMSSESWRPSEVIARDIMKRLDSPASMARSEKQHATLVDRVFQEVKQHPYGPYGPLSRDEVDWMLRYGGRLLPPGPEPAVQQSNN
ncbi:hypothetical protein [Mesorhizobium sp.]|uniref:hypothetical protein n=1 Tax=Mesorhizobium sp. TaxID=1871066 RepID=UPI000FE708C3|nr:hypothetical protein [Mesorhizobium sp.]RWM10445.1 MAG: hypothetical protein EOR71_06715 [Mesorhizobium sp.]